MSTHITVDEDRFWSKVSKGNEDECRLWQGATDADGYGKHYDPVTRRHYRAHRLAYELAYRHKPEVVLHACDNPACCNPRHLQNGTQQDNMRDRDRKDRQAKGAQNGRSKLTEAEIVEVRRLLREGSSQRGLARRFGVHHSTIAAIGNGKAWSHV